MLLKSAKLRNLHKIARQPTKFLIIYMFIQYNANIRKKSAIIASLLFSLFVTFFQKKFFYFANILY